jgi:hypothetical protein
MSYRVSSSQNQAARLLEGWRCTPAEVANDAIAWFDTLSQADADTAIDRLINRIIKILRAHAALHSSRDPGHVGFAAAQSNSNREEILTLKYAGAVHLDGVVDLLSPDS